jgi:Protein of unknown function (DUF2950)
VAAGGKRSAASMGTAMRYFACCFVLLMAHCYATLPARADPANFATPEAAAAALKSALAKDDVDALLDIFGRENSQLLLGPDPASSRVARHRAAAASQAKIVLRREAVDRITLVFGRNDWPMPIPLVRHGGQWSFDTAAGEQEILARRIGEDELSAIDTLKSFVQAERKYAAWRTTKGEGLVYAQYVQSTQGSTDGLWWDRSTAATFGPSPLADFAAKNREFLEGRRPGDPFKGYYFRVLTGQSADAPGGAMSYFENGRMTKGFAMIAWPAAYGNSGIMTFIVGPDGRVLRRDLGDDTGSLMNTMQLYDPGEGWTPER